MLRQEMKLDSLEDKRTADEQPMDRTAHIIDLVDKETSFRCIMRSFRTAPPKSVESLLLVFWGTAHTELLQAFGKLNFALGDQYEGPVESEYD